MKLSFFSLFLSLLFASSSVCGADDVDTSFEAFAEQLNIVKQDMISLGEDMLLMEDQLIYPAVSRVSVFLSLDVGEFFKLEAVQLKLQDRVVANVIYDPLETTGFERGAAQRLYIGNVAPGKYDLDAYFFGSGPRGRKYKRAVTYQFVKTDLPVFLELKISDRVNKLQPEFKVSQW